MSVESSASRTWSHFQNQAPGVFLANHPRLDFMLRTARRLARGARPSLLNIGLGDGHLEREAKALGWSVHSLDPDAEAVRVLSEQGIDAVAGSIESMPFGDCAFDVVVASEVLEHLTDLQRERGLAEVYRTLKPGGHLIGSVPYREDMQLNTDVCPRCAHVFHRWGHTTAFDLADVVTMLSAKLHVTTCKRTVFVEFKGKSMRGRFESLARLLAAKLGLGSVSIFFVARKS